MYCCSVGKGTAHAVAMLEYGYWHLSRMRRGQLKAKSGEMACRSACPASCFLCTQLRHTSGLDNASTSCAHAVNIDWS